MPNCEESWRCDICSPFSMDWRMLYCVISSWLAIIFVYSLKCKVIMEYIPLSYTAVIDVTYANLAVC